MLKIKDLRTKIIFVAILILAFLLRAQEAISGNFLFLLDQGRDMMAVKGIVFDHHMTLIGPNTSLQGVFQGPLWYYLLSIPTILLKGDPWGVILLMLLISMSVLFVAYFWAKKNFGIKAALLMTFFFAVCSEAAAAATYSWNPHPMWLITVIYIICFYNLIFVSKKYHLLIWPVIGLMFNFETALAVFILISTIIYLIVFNRKLLATKYFFIGIVLFSITFSPQILFDLRHNFLMTKSVLNVFSGHDRGLFVSGENNGYLNLINGHIWEIYSNFRSSFMQYGYLSYLPNIFLGLIVGSFVIVISVKNKIFSEKESAFIKALVTLILIAICLMLVYPFPIRYWFLTGFQSFYIILLGIVLSKFSKNNILKIALSLFAVSIIFYSIQRINILYFNQPDNGGTAKINGKLQALDFIYKDAASKNFNLLVFTPPVYTDAYDYLIWWYGQKKYNYVPGNKKTGVFYLLMEVDPNKPTSYNGWMETVIKTGSVVFTKTLPSGFVLQKRTE